MHTQQGMILSQEEARQAKDDVRVMVDSAMLDLLTAVEIQWDITCRTVPVA